MINNDILRRIRFIFDLSNAQVSSVFAKANAEVATDKVVAMLKKEEEEGNQAINDTLMGQF